MARRVVPKVCNLCEAMCGLRIHVEGRRVLRVEGDPDDPLSRGFLCPKAVALKEVQEDPDRLRRPLRRRGRDFEEVSWDEALGEAAERIAAIQRRDGDDAVAFYLGNPGAHSLGVLLAVPSLASLLATANRYSASSLDQNPRHAACILLFGNFLSIPVPDVDRTHFLLMLGANPVVSGGSLMTAPGMKRRLQALRARGGRLVVVDPRRTETARLADEHLALRPGSDGLLLAALLRTVLEEKLGREPPEGVAVTGREALAAALAPFAPEAVAPVLGVEAERLRGLARAFAAAPRAVAYGRVGTCQSPTATVSSWLIDVLNLVTGNLDRPGGAMFPGPAADLAALAELRGSPGEMDTGRTRVRGAPRFNGESPAACLAEEIATPGRGQVRGLLSVAGNPVLSAPNGRALDRALGGLEFYAAVDLYLNETTRHAHVVLPPSWSLEHEAYELLFHGFAVHNTARYSPTVVPPEPGQRDDFAILSELVLRLAERKAERAPVRLLAGAVRRLGLVPGPRRILDAMIRLGPYGDGFRPWRRGLRLRDVEAAPSGLDLGPLKPRLRELLEPHGGAIHLAPPVILAELARLAGSLAAPPDPADAGLVLIGRRDVRSNNSWMHNVRVSVKGRERCTLQMHPEDAARRGLAEGQRVRIASRVGAVEAPLELSEDLLPGVVCLPHGWGHTAEGTRLRLARQHPGVSYNDVSDDTRLEPVVGNAVLNGVPVEVTAARAEAIATH